MNYGVLYAPHVANTVWLAGCQEMFFACEKCVVSKLVFQIGMLGNRVDKKTDKLLFFYKSVSLAVHNMSHVEDGLSLAHHRHSSHCQQGHRTLNDCFAGTSLAGISGAVPAQSAEFYFYQSADGQCVFLHPLVSRALLAHYGSYAACPPEVSCSARRLYIRWTCLSRLHLHVLCLTHACNACVCAVHFDAHSCALHAGGSRELCATSFLNNTDACKRLSALRSLLTMPSFFGNQHLPVSVDWDVQICSVLCIRPETPN